jgi:class 3 adenylate cyclase
MDGAAAPPGDLTLHIGNTAEREVLLQVQINDWDAQSVSAAEITTVQKFRDLFADEAIEPGQEMSIGRLAFLFSDLEGSTALYEQVGDVPAFALIRNHFKFMRERVERNRGAIVKTMGDAVMAVFANPRDALKTAAEVQKDAVALLKKQGADAKFKIKVGVHAGPCVVVGTNGIVDYFGTTVNLAQRTQGAAHCGDVVLCETFYNEINGRELLDGGWDISKEDLLLRGFQTPITLLRIHPK